MDVGSPVTGADASDIGAADVRLGAGADEVSTGDITPKSLTEPAPDAPDAPDEYKSGKRLDREGVGLLTVEEDM